MTEAGGELEPGEVTEPREVTEPAAWDSAAEARRWWLQADNDVGFARFALREGYCHQACFAAQQAAEKAVKSIGYYLGDRTIPEHSVVALVDRYAAQAPGLADLRESANVLDLYYVPSRYPHGLPGGVPFRSFSDSQAREAADSAEAFVRRAGERIGEDARDDL